MTYRAAGGRTSNERKYANRSQLMIIVAGALTVDPNERDAYLDGCASVVAAARQAQGCHDFALSPDLLDAGRINVYERWDSDEDLHRFRGSGPDDGQRDALLSIQVNEWAVVARPR
jgi:quinol monooxygenase YgiN